MLGDNCRPSQVHCQNPVPQLGGQSDKITILFHGRSVRKSRIVIEDINTAEAVDDIRNHSGNSIFPGNIRNLDNSLSACPTYRLGDLL